MVFTLYVLHHTTCTPRKLCSFELQGVHSIQCFALTYESEGSQSLLVTLRPQAKNRRPLTLNVLYHTIPHQLCRCEVKDAHGLQSFVSTHSEESDRLLFIPCLQKQMLLTSAFSKENSAICDPPPRNESKYTRWPFSCFYIF